AGLTIAEIAEVTGVSTEAAKSRLRYAVKKLRAGLKEND
ncbi:MAG: RNA polymerase subunit sigma-24, partial [Gammaproteobacteria bacterium]|nr:RNA polymerase subunit sigma-24 [Gammaproteobacteria bacterium]